MLAKWCEPPEVDRLHLSTLVQQVMSTIAETGGFRELRGYGRFVSLCQQVRTYKIGYVDHGRFVSLCQQGTAPLQNP